VEGEINIASAAELKKLLLEALASGKDLRLDLGGATEVDVTTLQLFWAAEREARRLGVGFTLLGCVPEPISITLGIAGFEKFPIPADPK
jgi:anti-anti-sigma regulatory factor